jgi:hypothetical protein
MEYIGRFYLGPVIGRARTWKEGESMRKIFASGLILAVLLAISMSVPALANVVEEDINYVENVNRRIQHLIDKATEKADEALAVGDQDSIDEIRSELFWDTSDLVNKAMEWAENKGFALEHEWITVIVGGEPIQIDPIHVLW